MDNSLENIFLKPRKSVCAHTWKSKLLGFSAAPLMPRKKLNLIPMFRNNTLKKKADLRNFKTIKIFTHNNYKKTLNKSLKVLLWRKMCTYLENFLTLPLTPVMFPKSLAHEQCSLTACCRTQGHFDPVQKTPHKIIYPPKRFQILFFWGNVFLYLTTDGWLLIWISNTKMPGSFSKKQLTKFVLSH